MENDDLTILTAEEYVIISEVNGLHRNIRGQKLSSIFLDIYGSLSCRNYIPVRSIKVHQWSKSPDDSIQFRAKGNNHYIKGEYMEALQLFTLAIGKAYENSQEISLAYGNRSALTLHLGEYSNSLSDIKHALGSKYPNNLVYKLKEREGDCLLATGDVIGAISAFENAVTSLQVNDLDESKINHQKKKEIEDKIIQAKTKLKGNKEKNHTSKHDFILSHKQSPTIECASEAVKIDYNKEMGRMVVANVNISRGDVIAIERPSVSIVGTDEHLFCDFCLKRAHSSVPCKTCSRVFFCDEDCREKSWKQSHEIECILFPALILAGFDEQLLLAVRSMLLMTDQGKSLQDNATRYMLLEENKKNPDFHAKGFVDEIYPSGKIETAYYLETCENKRDTKNLIKDSVFAACVFQQLKTTKFFDSIVKTDFLNPGNKLTQIEKTVGGIILNFIQIAQINALPVMEFRGTRIGNHENIIDIGTIGTGLYNFISLFNHSCDPNVVGLNDKGNGIILVAVKPIKKGDQVFVSYGYSYFDEDIRLRQLASKMRYFNCKCLPCIKNWPVFVDLPYDKYLKNVDCNEIIQFKMKMSQIGEKLYDFKHLSFMIRFLDLIEKTHEMPSATYINCQRGIMKCLAYQGNYYSF